ncbi:hypothetical protein BGX21_004835, partial [Mortierella sp. AD011]
MSQPSRARQLRRRAMQQVDQSSQEPEDSLGKWDQQITDIEQFQRLQQRQQRHLDRPPSYLDSIAAPQSSISSSSPSNSEVSTLPSQQVSYNLIPSLFSSDDQNPQNPQDDEEDLTWLLAVVLATALLISLISLVRVLRQKFGLFSLFGNSDNRGAHGGHGHGLGGGSSRYPGHGPHQVPSEDDPDPDAQLNENDERWALMTEAQRLAFDSTR